MFVRPSNLLSVENRGTLDESGGLGGKEVGGGGGEDGGGGNGGGEGGWWRGV